VLQTRQEIFSAAPSGVALQLENRVCNVPAFPDSSLTHFPQNLPSAFATHALGIDGTEKNVLDMCAAPGGKTSHLAELIEERGSWDTTKLYAFEKSSNRARRLKADIGAKFSQIVVKKQDSTKVPTSYDNFFDKVLLDAPCSALGQRPRKIPEIEPEPQIVPVQRALLIRAFEILKPGGTLVYSTCSVTRCENEENVEFFMNKFSGLVQLEEIRSKLNLEKQSSETQSGFVRFDPWADAGVSRQGGRETVDLNGTELHQLVDFPSITNNVDTDTIGFFVAKFTKL